MELPIILANPALDIILISVLFNVFAYGAYVYLYKREFSKIASVDIRLSLVELLLVVINYYGSQTVVTVLGISFQWWVWYIIISIPIEILFFMSYKRYFNLTWDDIAGSAYRD